MAYTKHVWATYEMITKDLLNHAENGIADNDTAIATLNSWKSTHGKVIEGSVTLTNTQQYPFNNSIKSVSLGQTLANADYVVVIKSAVSSDGANVGDIVVTDRLANGFKLALTGSATSVTVTYYVIGGFTL